MTVCFRLGSLGNSYMPNGTKGSKRKKKIYGMKIDKI